MRNKNIRLRKLVATSVLFASASWASAMDIQGFFSAGGGVTFDVKKLPRFENMIADQSGTNHNLNTASEYHKTVAPSISDLSSRFNAHRDNKIGLQFHKKLGDDLSITTQLVAKGNDSYFDLNANWAFLSWNPQPDFTVRAGRLVIPLFMLSEYREVGYAFPWVRPPMEMYSGVPISSWSGMDFSWTGYKGDWDYRVTAAVGTVNQNIWIGTIQDEFIARNGASLSAEFGNDYFRIRLGGSRIDASSTPGVATVDGLVGNIGTLYAGWAVNKFDTGGTINAVDIATWESLLGDITSNTVEAAATAGGLTWSDVTAEIDTAANLPFLRSSTVVGLGATISQGLYGESTNAGDAVLKAFDEYTANSGTLGDLKNLGTALAAVDDTTRNQIQASINAKVFADDLGVFLTSAGGAGNTATNMNGLSANFNNYDALILTLGAASTTIDTGDTEAEYNTLVAEAGRIAGLAADSAEMLTTITTFKTQDLANGDVLNTDAADTIVGALGAFGATENSGRFNAVASLLALSGDSTAANYGLLQNAIDGAVNETYLMELREYLYKTFEHEWRSGSFLSAGYTYDYDNWYSIGEYGYRRVPGHIGDTQGWYLTLGRRFGALMPHITYAGVSVKDTHVRQVSAGIATGDATADNDWRDMLDNVQNDADPISDVTYESMMYGLNQLQEFWIDNQGYSQNSLTVGVRYDWKPGVCLKAEVQHIRPKLGSRGFFEPWDKTTKLNGNTLALSIDAVF